MPDLKKTIFIAVGAVMTACAAVGSVLFSRAVVNNEKYPVMGVDVSHYQGEINWSDLEEQGVSFAFIKATEGSSHRDEYIQQNLEAAAGTDILTSAYHFFSFDSPGETQAENFISVVDENDIDMMPVVDVEYYGDKFSNKPDEEEAEAILRPLLEKLEEHYGQKPLIYTTLSVYNKYIRSEFGDYPLWIRNVYCEPELIDWEFWQYSDKGRLYGFNGEEQYIDLNVYCGSREEFIEKYVNGGGK